MRQPHPSVLHSSSRGLFSSAWGTVLCSSGCRCSAVHPNALHWVCPALPGLRHLSIRGSSAGEAGLKAVSGCTELRRLDLGCCLGLQGPEALPVALGCTALRLLTACGCLRNCPHKEALCLLEQNGCDVSFWQHDDLMLVHV